MKRNNTEQIGDVVRQFLRLQGLETPLNEYRLVDAWKDVVGPVITRYTTNLFIKNQVLYVSLSSSVIRQELMMGREMLIRNLNAQVGSQVIVKGYCEHCVPLNMQPCSVHTSSMGRSVASTGICGNNWN